MFGRSVEHPHLVLLILATNVCREFYSSLCDCLQSSPGARFWPTRTPCSRLSLAAAPTWDRCLESVREQESEGTKTRSSKLGALPGFLEP